LFAERSEKRNAVVVVVVDQEHGEAALDGRMPGCFRRVRSEQRPGCIARITATGA
jgi:hypothetical protein